MGGKKKTRKKERGNGEGGGKADGAGGGSIVTIVANQLKSLAIKVESNNKLDEFMVTRMDHVKPALNIVHIYGQNEGRAGQQKVLDGWTEILAELGKIEARDEVALVVGDFNRAVGNSDLGVDLGIQTTSLIGWSSAL